MKLDKLIREINKHSWWEEKSAAVYQYVMYPLHCFVEQCRYYHPRYLSLSVFVSTPGDFFHELTPEDEKSKIYWYIFQQLQKDSKYLIRKRQACDRAKIFINVAGDFEKKSSLLTNHQAWLSYQKFLRYYLIYCRYVVALECVDPFTQYEMEGLIKTELARVTDDKIREVTRLMATPAHLSFMEREHQEILKFAINLYPRFQKNTKILLNQLENKWQQNFQQHANSYYWMQNSYATVMRLTPEYFFDKVRDEIRRKALSTLKRELKSLNTKVRRIRHRHQTILNKYKFSPELRKHFQLVQYIGEWIDNRKEHMLQGNDCLERYCRELARRFSVPIHDVHYYLPDDFKALLLYGRRLNRRIIHGRQTFSAYVIEKRGKTAVPKIYYGQQAKKIFQAIQSRFQVTKGQVTGQVASAPLPKFTGKVHVIKDVHKEKFIDGRILVASMTRPDFVPLMRRAKAIITDEGGLTCHAAIVSRELRIPCIIGTKNATAEFKTGDRVMMDLKTGAINKH